MSYTRLVAVILLHVFAAFIIEIGHAEQARAGITFVARAPHAKSVAVIGNFNGWDGKQHLLVGPDAAGDWTATFALGSDAAYLEFVFLIDGALRLVDSRYPTVADDFGSVNNVIGAP